MISNSTILVEYFPYVFTYEKTTSSVLPTLQNFVTFEEPPEFTISDDLAAIYEPDHAESPDILESVEPQDNVLSESISDDQPTPVISPSAEVILQNPAPQDRRSRDKHIKLVNIIGEPPGWYSTQKPGSEFNVASTHECYMSIFLSEIEPRSSLHSIRRRDGYCMQES
ncbi:hypothetical protein Tco_1088568 [Tanacetum coccineum]